MGSDDLFYVDQKPIPTCFTKCNFNPGQPINFKVSHIYDPSKFWIVVKFQELEIFQKHLFQYYYLNRNKYKMPTDNLQLDMPCVAFTDGNYYRGRIVGLPQDLWDQNQVHVFFTDYGSLQLVDYNNIFYMSVKHCEVPQFSVRASLAQVRPKNSHCQWTVADVTEFSNLLSDKVLAGVVENVYREREVVEVACRERGVGAAVHDTLVAQQRTQYRDEELKSGKKMPPPEPKYFCAHVCPSHEAIESGKVPTSLSDAEFQVMVAPFSPIVTRYYQVKDA
ncbi:tudor domain-containing protein 5-like [Zophobas morio]|uniref:tudor domain-containing protein 5-like n=1 Tax=Zophobas morio TaxID=2755281 RepID=UPI0030827002